ncbi:hypothetical protein [Paenibacillus sp. 1001270B_150601_E10]|uniref:hypothetical protein n=1 Tax=Paenibacillus sp. 1001270B_150601_E10 TaxID=2787079 RepID=UPI00189FCB1C|nr:hypothetical protein [Paenibacillus sp. 1001270B_150601_E10]
MGVYYSEIYDNPVAGGETILKAAELQLTNLYDHSANVLIRLICDGSVTAEHLYKLNPKGQSQSVVRIPELRLASGPFCFQVFTTITGHHPIELTVRLKDAERNIRCTLQTDAFKEVDVIA